MTKTRAHKRRAKRRAAHSRRRDHGHVDFTTRDRELVIEAMTAEQSGDLEQALGCLERTPHRFGSSWVRQLVELLTLGDRAEEWQWARFAVAAGQRWAGVIGSPLAAKIEREICAAAGVGLAPGPDDHSWRVVAEHTAIARAAADVLLFDELMLELFLVRIAPELDRRGGGGRTWASTPACVYEPGEVAGVELRVRDRGTGERQVVRHLGETVGLPPDALLYGRILRVPGEPGAVFAGPPMAIDEAGARQLERLPDSDPYSLVERCAGIGAALRSGAGYLQAPPDYDEEPAAGVRLLMEQGLDRIGAERFALVQSLVAMYAVDPGSTPAYAFHAADALADSLVEEEVRRRLVGPSYSALWRALAAVSSGLDRERFESLAAAEPVTEQRAR
ncbi:hypothetical protein [Jiangella rhizosphaerae]|uniref:Uncharacterized protein n=1 Tax=Jiangella rhizosphaerae TaxID=2293569 RepID=A0A418KG39_9ACTN|nr:hypothetical protein [Jiangella rhizosphaerae]RIQ10944.1 hypothetical protein DY240_30650 [Jiangella rhizosphaerae]